MTTPQPTTVMTEIQQPKRKMRPFSWVILAINALFLIWIIGGTASASPSTDAEIVGTGIGVMIIVMLWAFADVILGILWLVTRKRQPQVVVVHQAPAQPMPAPYQPMVDGQQPVAPQQV